MRYILFLILFVHSSPKTQEILIPISSKVKDAVFFSDSSKQIIGNGFFPVSYTEANYKFPNKDTTASWFRRKLFAEHFIQQEGEKYLLAIDPLLNMTIGKDQLGANEYLFQNTRGFQVTGQLIDKISFYTAFYENQARFMAYQNTYFNSRGELYPSGGVYARKNAVIPGGGRTKPFKTNGFDYASAVSYVRFKPINQLAISLGNHPEFYGFGHRSLLLSDNSFNFTHLTIDWNITSKFSYRLMRGKQLNLRRKMYTNQVEAPYERKGIGIHYLSYQPISSLSIGLFESSVYLRDEATSSQRVNPLFYQPVIGINSTASGAESGDMKNLFGLNIGWKFHPNHMVYAQAVSDDLSRKEYGFQLGYRTGNTFGINNLRFQVEYNQASAYLFAAQNKRMSYTHFNLPIAHTLGNGFQEIILRASYSWKAIYIEGQLMYYETEQPLENKSDLFESKLVVNGANPTTVRYGKVEIGYELNPSYHLCVFARGVYRKSQSIFGANQNSNAFFIGIRTALRNKNVDF